MPIEWVLIVTVLSLGPYPVALKSYPTAEQCYRAAEVASYNAAARGECIRVVVPTGAK
jgi:hypothetical protein